MTNVTNRYYDLLGVVLCGGRATRMGGKDKGLVDFRGQPMARYAVAALQHCQKIVINANRNHQAYQDLFKIPVISDENSDFDGPLAGMLAALRYAKSIGLSWVITIPCDAPFVDSKYVDIMRVAQAASDKKIFMASDEFRQPVFSLLHISVIEPLAAFLHSQQNKIICFYEEYGYENVLFSAKDYFININTLAETDK